MMGFEAFEITPLSPPASQSAYPFQPANDLLLATPEGMLQHHDGLPEAYIIPGFFAPTQEPLSPVEPSNPAGDTELRVAQLLCSRLCHDLAGPAGGLSAGIEFLSESTGDASAMSLLDASARQMAGRLRFYRIAFGLAGNGDGTVPVGELRELCTAFLADGRVKLDWQVDQESEIAMSSGVLNGISPVSLARVMLCAVLLAAGTLPRGGTLEVSMENRAKGVCLSVSAQGKNARLSEDLTLALAPTADVGSLTSRTVHAHVLGRLAAVAKAALTIDDSVDDEVRVSVNIGRRAVANEASKQFFAVENGLRGAA